MFLFVWFDSLRPINNLSVIKGRIFLGWTSTKLGLMFLLKDTTQWRRWGSNPRPFGLESSTLSLSHCAPYLIQRNNISIMQLSNGFWLITYKSFKSWKMANFFVKLILVILNISLSIHTNCSPMKTTYMQFQGLISQRKFQK